MLSQSRRALRLTAVGGALAAGGAVYGLGHASHVALRPLVASAVAVAVVAWLVLDDAWGGWDGGAAGLAGRLVAALALAVTVAGAGPALPTAAAVLATAYFLRGVTAASLQSHATDGRVLLGAYAVALAIDPSLVLIAPALAAMLARRSHDGARLAVVSVPVAAAAFALGVAPWWHRAHPGAGQLAGWLDFVGPIAAVVVLGAAVALLATARSRWLGTMVSAAVAGGLWWCARGHAPSGGLLVAVAVALGHGVARLAALGRLRQAQWMVGAAAGGLALAQPAIEVANARSTSIVPAQSSSVPSARTHARAGA